MPSETITSATMTSMSVKPAERMRSMMLVVLFGDDAQLAVELRRQLETAVEAAALHLDRERSDLAARQQHDLRLGVLDVLRLKVGIERHVAAVEDEGHGELRAQH